MARWLPLVSPCAVVACLLVPHNALASPWLSPAGQPWWSAAYAPGQAWPPPPHVVRTYCQVMHRAALCLPYHLAPPCSVRSQQFTSPTSFLLAPPPTTSQRRATARVWPHAGTPSIATSKALTDVPLARVVISPLPCLVGSWSGHFCRGHYPRRGGGGAPLSFPLHNLQLKASRSNSSRQQVAEGVS